MLARRVGAPSEGIVKRRASKSCGRQLATREEARAGPGPSFGGLMAPFYFGVAGLQVFLRKNVYFAVELGVAGRDFVVLVH